MKSHISILITTLSILLTIGCVSSSKDNKTRINITCHECAGMEVFLSRSSILHTGANEVYQSKFDSVGRAEIEFVQLDTLSLLLVVENKDQAEWKFSTTLYFEPYANIELTIENGLPRFTGDLRIINTYYHYDTPSL
ncbi:hypothetical protein CLV98_1261 [Dyadobacter jejuensis]|uniref:Uncharacterized protein n=1 Tax=Dyadobacter jejuensis TaxID=1082580 RepID=A0A316A6I3_9BACT|nr:hypothetical protein [Dyadobacter jejuensis]PWJ53092.1 hypothetical protein CLV98_1261 [Dyadobacter jejuensis]